ncbi:prepilin-type N-terminal cleavage/methylation domain-containing protein, partial [Candidatus Saccharibacteria bacterium]|nr:prepilin-type N-terminal cleavage/methylation domain-containing protein [Candidatus Saccharibacteria bacterium]
MNLIMKTWAKNKKTGFTIVELLIVIVVIAILAAITIVAYNGIQQRSRDSIRKSDLM